jgi:hypothetical protein
MAITDSYAWSSFLIDLYTNDDIIAWLDTDSPFLLPVTMPTIMTDGKVRILGPVV